MKDYSKPINLPQGYSNPHNFKRVRRGKTERDHTSGAWRQRLANRQARAELIRDTPWNKQLPAVL